MKIQLIKIMVKGIFLRMNMGPCGVSSRKFHISFWSVTFSWLILTKEARSVHTKVVLGPTEGRIWCSNSCTKPPVMDAVDEASVQPKPAARPVAKQSRVEMIKLRRKTAKRKGTHSALLGPCRGRCTGPRSWAPSKRGTGLVWTGTNELLPAISWNGVTRASVNHSAWSCPQVRHWCARVRWMSRSRSITQGLPSDQLGLWAYLFFIWTIRSRIH